MEGAGVGQPAVKRNGGGEWLTGLFFFFFYSNEVSFAISEAFQLPLCSHQVASSARFSMESQMGSIRDGRAALVSS